MTNDDEMCCLITGKPIQQWAKDAMTRKRPRMTDPTPAEALKACPFCGGAAIIWGTSSTSIQCTNDQCIIGESAPFNDFSHRADAIAAWNNRPDAGEVRTYRQGVEDAARVCAEWSTMLSMRVDDLIRIRAPQRTVKAIREAANQLLNAEAAIRKLP